VAIYTGNTSTKKKQQKQIKKTAKPGTKLIKNDNSMLKHGHFLKNIQWFYGTEA
jgi:hypothetical protein